MPFDTTKPRRLERNLTHEASERFIIMIPHVTTNWNGDATCTFPYDLDTITAIKDTIPPAFRSWDPTHKQWRVTRPYVGFVIDLLRRRFGEVEDHKPEGQRAFQPPPVRPVRPIDEDYAALHLLPSAPAALVSAAFKALAREAHPDCGGNHEHMLTLTGAYGRLRTRGVA